MKKNILVIVLILLISGCSLVKKPECATGTLVAFNRSNNSVFVVKNMEKKNTPIQIFQPGEKLVVTSFDYKNGRIVYTEDLSSGMFMYDLNTKIVKKFISEKIGWLFVPYFSPDGTQVVVSRWIGDNKSQLYIYDLESLLGKPHFEMVDGITYTAVVWRDRGILIHKLTNDIGEYFWLDPSTGITESTSLPLIAKLSLDNSTWLQRDETSKRFTLMDDATRNITTLWEIPESALNPVWSPDGRCIAYSLEDKVFLYSLTTKLTNEIELPKPVYNYRVVWSE